MTVLKYCFYVCILLASIQMACTSCGDGYFFDVNGQCLPCPLHCPFCDSTDKCLSCDNGYWGSVCENSCSNCQNGTSCEKTNGFCLEACRDGDSGILCDVACSEKCSSCSRTNISNCIKCATGRYPSKSCHRVCSKCNNMSCNEEGNCTAGCVEGNWGNNCESACSEHCLDKSCHKESGNCTHGCEGEYTGPRCNNGNETSTTIFVLVGTGSALIFLTVIVVTVVCIRRERQKHTGSKRRRFTDPGQREKDAETSPFIVASNVGEGPIQLKTVKKGMLKLQELLESIEQRTEENIQSEFEKLPVLLNKDATSDAKQVLPFKENTVLVEGKAKEAYTTNASLITVASFLDMPDMPDAIMYIASGGPRKDVYAGFSLFWTMLWQLKCQTVVMLYNINEKNKSSEQYWPDNEDKYGDWNVRNIEYKRIHDSKCKKRTFEVFAENQEQDTLYVKLLHYYEWAEKGIADNIQKLLNFREEVNRARQDDSGPLVVLCRNGAGRTGTYVALDMLLRMVDYVTKRDDEEKTKVIDIFACVMHLRKQRMKMVETVEQYKFLYQALSYYISRIANDKDRQETQTQDDSDRRHVKGETKV